MLTLIIASALLIAYPLATIYADRFLATSPSTPSEEKREPRPYARPIRLSNFPRRPSLDMAAPDPCLRPDGIHSRQRSREPIHALDGTKKPWDPPFPTSPHGSASYNPNTSERRTAASTPGVGEQRGAERGQEEGEFKGIMQKHGEPTYLGAETISVQTHRRAATSKRSRIMAVLLPILSVLGIITFIFAFAVLIAHCLAWLIVYKTEARLGEARRGIVKGGEMRVCLCARG
ncbi:hypothetical protein BDV96DRAFT_406779 [Lophiotrema nucula]|uniref:Uncharacterized protein n=1 Tax=Lophiotrema nucula TaxID=690887 RepID=A0A6A5ZFE5_9PLEO|nr:hypothetical protein BDV96DRAFT_406779 [Lophiotrema nucula]